MGPLKGGWGQTRIWGLSTGPETVCSSGASAGGLGRVALGWIMPGFALSRRALDTRKPVNTRYSDGPEVSYFLSLDFHG